MIYKFKSKAAADLIMTGPVGDRVLALIGKAPQAKGIIEVADMPAALRALEAAAGAEHGSRDAGQNEAPEAGPGEPGDAVSLRQRVWPLAEMIKHAQAANEPIVWGT
jgi:hypothetical protein